MSNEVETPQRDTGANVTHTELSAVVNAQNARSQKVLNFDSGDNLTRYTQLRDLADALLDRFLDSGGLDDINGAVINIDKCIAFQRRAIAIMGENGASKPGQLPNLGSALISRFDSSGNLVDADEAITLQTNAVELTPDGHAGESMYFNGLAGPSFTDLSILVIHSVDRAIALRQ
ncbi:uncharacterized protein STEHIDRAFT_160225 [Stereum hirsutum FP-91666 SS1]|uniref:uncharacterized protein n=1 Tax=Stereum hirsutum (strain FP-91666) TaxID=721885 RepID=UPI0004449DBB|nr:uncharacterized protein STEHIDRAFT_160225 [Stereum hirsutum FP-91666 SS1]EIM83649.1 hypothetical protein STEHIDRAFT_160225 [Stereum hirsutum FP-91666 SS1]